MKNEAKLGVPETVLRRIIRQNRGHLKIFIGYAPGVGKTFSMLSEANRRLARGQDVVIGYIETHQSKETEEQIGNLEIVPRKKIQYEGKTYEEMDTDEIIWRLPKVVLVDELAHANAPGSRYEKRYEDIENILNHGIDVISTMNIQHLESLNDVVKQITGITVEETVPDRIVEKADEVVVVDVTPDSLMNRMKRGNIITKMSPDEMQNLFRKGNLNALRELTLRQTAEEVNEDLEEYMDENGIEESWQTVERVMVCIGSGVYAKKLIRRGARIARRYKCEWFVVHVESTRIAAQSNDQAPASKEDYFELARQLGAEVVNLRGKSASEELAKFASSKHITQILIGHNNRTTVEKIVRGSTVNKLLKQTKNIEVHIIPHE